MAAPKWRGPWIGKSIVIPTPTGTFRLKPDAITQNNLYGDNSQLDKCLSIVNDVDNLGYGYLLTDNDAAYLLRATFDANTSIYLDSDVTPTALASLPAGFFVTSATVGSHGCAPNLNLWTPDGANDPYQMFYQFSEAIESPTWGVIPNYGTDFDGYDYPGYPTMAELLSMGMGIRAVKTGLSTGHIIWYRDHGGDMNGTDGALQLRGTYYAP